MPYSSQTSRFISAGTLRTFLVYPVLWVDFSQTRYPVIVVPGDVDIPVVCRSAIGQGNNRRLHDGAIYVRTLDSNNAPSSAPASWKDIEKLFEVCFRNREANYAEFFSRVIRAADPAAVRSLLSKARDMAVQAFEGFDGVADFQKRGEERFAEIVRFFALLRLSLLA